jgi:hypothetical protein
LLKDSSAILKKILSKKISCYQFTSGWLWASPSETKVFWRLHFILNLQQFRAKKHVICTLLMRFGIIFIDFKKLVF